MTIVQKRIVASAAAIALMAGLFVGFQPIGGTAAVGGMNISAEGIVETLDNINGANVTLGVAGDGTTPTVDIAFTTKNGGDAGVSFTLAADKYDADDDGTGNLDGYVYVTVGGSDVQLTFNGLKGGLNDEGKWSYTGTAYYGTYGYDLNVVNTSLTTYSVGITPGSRPQPQPEPEPEPAPAPAAPDPLANYVPGPGGATPSATTETPAADAAADAAAETPATPAAPAADVAATADGDVDTAAAATFLTEAAAEATTAGETEVVAEIASDVTVISETAIAELIASVPEDIEVKLESKVEAADGKDAGSILIPLAADMPEVKTGVKAASDTAIEKTAAALDAEFVGGFTTAQKGTFGTEVTFSLKASAFGIDVEKDLADCELTKSGYKKVYIIVVVDGKPTQVEGLINKSGKIVFRTDLAGTYYVSAKPVL